MIRSFYMTATNMIVQKRKLDVISNNIANVETYGYKSDHLVATSFNDVLITRLGDDNYSYPSKEVSPLNHGVHIDEVVTVFDQGPLKQTGTSSDVALVGEGFFVINTAGGERYTRDGNFMINSEGYLVTSSGDFVSGTNGNIRINDRLNFTVDSSGNVTSGGTSAGQIRIVNFGDLTGLRKSGTNLYINYTNQPAQAAQGTEVKQGYLEGSNVQVAEQIVDMMGVYRSYETSQRVIRMLDESMGRAVNDIGKI